MTASLIAVTVRRDPLLAGDAADDMQLVDVRPDTAVIVEPASPRLSLSAERDTDLFLADFSFFGFTVDKTSTPTSLVATAAQTSDNWIGVVIQLPPRPSGRVTTTTRRATRPSPSTRARWSRRWRARAGWPSPSPPETRSRCRR